MSANDINESQDTTPNLCVGASIIKNDDLPLTIEEAREMKRGFKQRENKLQAELQDAKDQAELLEFRVLELEEEQEKVKLIEVITTS